MDAVEEQVRLLAAALGLDAGDPARVLDLEALHRDIAAGDRIRAIRNLRRRSGLGLVAAVRIVTAAADG